MCLSSESVDVFAVVDKPPHLTSNEVSAYLKRIAKVNKAGHVGTLDPLVSGVLPVALGRARKFVRFIQRSVKEYVGVARFESEVDYDAVVKVFERFVGEVWQLPPEHSAVAKRWRKRKIYELEVLEVEGRDVLFRAKVEAGTYIRVLCKDFGKVLGMEAFMKDLRRVRAGVWRERDAHTLLKWSSAFYALYEEGDDSCVRKMAFPIHYALRFPKVVIKNSAFVNVCRGAQLMRPGIVSSEGFEQGDYVTLWVEDKFVGIGRALRAWSDVAARSHGLVIKTEQLLC